MGTLLIKPNVKLKQREYYETLIGLCLGKQFNPVYESAVEEARNVLQKMNSVLQNLVTPKNINIRISPYRNFHKGFPIIDFKSSNKSSQWYFAYIKNENGEVIVFDMQNINQNQGRTFVNDEVQKSLDFMKRLLEVKI